MVFDFFLWGNKIGDLTATRVVKADSSEFFTIHSRSVAKILWINRENETTLEVTYKNGILLSSSHKEYETGKLSKWTIINKNGSSYELQTEKARRSFTELPVFSIVSAYFKTALMPSRIFDEALGEFYSFRKTDTNVWEYKTSEGSRYVYIYQNGKLSEMEFHVSIATVKAKRRN